jgi:DNA (cytosine-5)-methyltransferase 1
MILYNHIACKLCDYEAQLVPYIPQGGNWKDLPDSFHDKRLDSIRATGGRTTYYGRLRWEKPSYTIATYFNRVPNGCNIHPDQNRILSNREAARLQSFPDSFVFKGSKASQFKQIGNAVPPLLARYVSSLIKPYLQSYNFVDLFAGCGGLSEGFIMNGFQLVAANEIDSNIMMTNEFNHSRYAPKENFILGDITRPEVQQRLFDACEGKEIDVIVGGPPCQGFSYAGWRDPNDKRNQLFREFVTVVCKLQPKFFIMENVPGILTMKGGETIREIIAAFREVGYYVSTPIKLNAEEYGVPQKRRRVIIIGSLSPEIQIQSPQPLFSDDSQTLPRPITVKDAIGNLPPLADGGGEVETDFSFGAKSAYDRLMLQEIGFEEFYDLCMSQSNPTSFS